MVRGNTQFLGSRGTTAVLVAIAITVLFIACNLAVYGWPGASTLRTVWRSILGLHANNSDSWMPMLAALEHFKNRGGGIYNELFFNQGIKFQYSPSSLLPLMALENVATLSYEFLNDINAVLSALTSVAVAVFAYLASGKIAGYAPDRRLRYLLAIYCGAASVLYFPYAHALAVGQLQVWINLLFAAAGIFYLLDKKAAAGVFIGLIVILKPQFALFAVWGLVRGEYRFLVAFAITALIFQLISLAIFGLDDHLDYLRALSFISRHGEAYFPNQSVNGMLSRLVGNDPEWDNHTFAAYHPVVHIGTLLTSGALVISALVFPKTSDRPLDTLAFLVAGLIFTMASPIAWEHHYGVLPPLLILLLVMSMAGWLRPVEWVLLGACYFLTTFFAKSLFHIGGSLTLTLIQPYFFYSVVGLLFATWRIALRHERKLWLPGLARLMPSN